VGGTARKNCAVYRILYTDKNKFSSRTHADVLYILVGYAANLASHGLLVLQPNSKVDCAKLGKRYV
jgi:hypothetical protein